MAVTLSSLAAEVREMAADPDITELPDSKIENILDKRVLRWINRRRPGKAISYFETVAAQQDYDEKPSNAYRVTQVWWMDANFEFFSPSMRYVPSDQDMTLQMSGFNVLDNPALVEAFFKKVDAYKNNFKGHGEENEAGLIRLVPYPASTGDKVYYEYSYPIWSAVKDVSEVFLEGVRFKATELVYDVLAAKRGRVRSGRTFTGGGGANEKELAIKYGKEANREVPVSSAVFSRG